MDLSGGRYSGVPQFQSRGRSSPLARRVWGGWAAALACLAQAPGPTRAAEGNYPTGPALGEMAGRQEVVARVFYGERERLADLVSRYDVFEFADHVQGYVLARLTLAEGSELAAAGWRLEVDPALTRALQGGPRPAAPQAGGIPGYPCYRTVEETEAALDRLEREHPGLVRVVVLGPSWEKTVPGGAAGYDLRALVLSNPERPGPKPRFLLLAAHHARELTTAETALRFAEELLAGHGRDPEATWLLDFHEVHVLPVANPDGRKLAERGLWWRKNTSNTNGCSEYPRYGTDLNRNCGFNWGGVGASDLPCSEVYHGPAEFSEPENRALRDYVRALFPARRPPDDVTPAPETAPGLVVSLHSFSELVLHPWGWTTNPAPNAAALAALGAKFAFFNRYRVLPSIGLYPTTGSLDDWVYGERGVAAYTFELGRAFFEDCAEFESRVYPANRPALWYAAKAAREPFRAPAGPDVVRVTVTPERAVAGTRVRIEARAEATRWFGLDPLPAPRQVVAGGWSLDVPPGADTPVLPLAAADGALDSPEEELVGELDTSTWPPGRHLVFVAAQNEDGIWGLPTAAFVRVEPLTLGVSLEAERPVLRWPSVPGRTFTVWEAVAPDGAFVPRWRGLADRAPENTLPLPPPEAATRFYRLQVDP